MVYDQWCPMAYFKKHVDAFYDFPFPVPAAMFEEVMMQFIKLNDISSFWRGDGETKGLVARFYVDISGLAPSMMRDRWEAYVQRWNDGAVRQARGAWQVSPLWVADETQTLLLESTTQTFIIVVASVFVCMLLFTQNVVISLYVVMSTLATFAFLAFFMIVIMQWPIGAFEVVALIVFLGYAVTYALHIGHKYSSRAAIIDADLDVPKAVREARVSFAIRIMGQAAIGSAITTTICSCFLLTCTLVVFNKLGGVVLVVTLVSLLMSFGPLCAALLLCGPQQLVANKHRMSW